MFSVEHASSMGCDGGGEEQQASCLVFEQLQAVEFLASKY